MLQLVYTSVPSGLVPGRSGFCTVARHREMPERLVSALEKISVYEPPPEHGRAGVFSFRALAVGGENFGVLSGYCDAGLDYTSRRNYLVHHFVFDAGEMKTLPPPAEVARRFCESGKWMSAWSESPRFLAGDIEVPAFLRSAETKLPAATWQKITADAGNAAALCPSGLPEPVAISREGLDDATLLRLFAEASLLVRGGAWSAGWTTCIQKTDTVGQMPWRGVPAGTAGEGGIFFPAKLGTVAVATPAVRHARTGISPDRQPKAAGVPKFDARISPGAARKDFPVFTANAASPKRLGATIFAGAALFAVGFAGAIFFLSIRDGNDAGESVSPAALPAPGVAGEPQSFSKIYSGETGVRELRAAVNDRDWINAAALWKKLLSENPSAAESVRNEILPRVKAQLAGAFSAEAKKRFDALSPGFSPEAAGALKKYLSNAALEISEIDAAVSSQSTGEFKKIRRQLELLDSLPELPKNLISFTWGKSGSQKNEPASGFVFDNAGFAAFLNRVHGDVLMTVSVPGMHPIPNAGKAGEQKILIPAENFVRGKAFYVNTTDAGSPSIYFEVEGGKVRVTHAKPKVPGAVDELFAGAKSFRLALSDAGKTQGGAFEATFVSPDEAAPFRAPVEMLEYDPSVGALSVPAWLAGVLRQCFETMQPVLFPAKREAHSPNDFTTPVVSREKVIDLLRFENVRLQNEIAALKKKISELEYARQTAHEVVSIDDALRGAKTSLTEKTHRQQRLAGEIAGATSRAGQAFVRDFAPWAIGLRDKGNGGTITLIILE